MLSGRWLTHWTWQLLDLLDFNDHLHLPQSSTSTAETLLFKTKPTSKIFSHVCFASLQLYPSPRNCQHPCTKPIICHGHFWISKLWQFWPLHHDSISFTPSVTFWNWLQNSSPRNLTCIHPTFWDHDFSFHPVPAWCDTHSTRSTDLQPQDSSSSSLPLFQLVSFFFWIEV